MSPSYDIPPYSGETIIERKMPFEFGYMIYPGMASPIVGEVLKKRGFESISVIREETRDVVFFDQYTYLLDINEVFSNRRIKGPKPLWAYVTTSSSSRHRVEISREASDSSFRFQEILGPGRLPFWLVDPNEVNPPWIQIEFPKSAQILEGFTFGVFVMNNRNAFPSSVPMDCRLQGSMDTEQWVDLNITLAGRNKDIGLYKVMKSGSYKKYRFYLNSQDFSKPMPVSVIQMRLAISH